jgi:hypothetical protein
MWPALTGAGTGVERLRVALDALCGIADRHLHLLTVSDDVYHLAARRVRDITGQEFSFLDPFTAALEAGRKDGTLRVQDEVGDLADAVFNTVCWGYVHLRHRHRWSDERARRSVVALVLDGVRG